MKVQIKNTQDLKEATKALVTGFERCKVLIVNPTTEEMTSVLGYKDPKDPTYWNEEKQTLRLDIHLQGDLRRYKLTMWIEKKVAESKTGKTQYISGIGKTKWVETKEELDKWLEEDSNLRNKDGDAVKNKDLTGHVWRKAFVGEERLMEFIMKYLQADTKDKTQEIKFDNSIFTDKGIKEFNDLLNEDNDIGVVLYVKNGYQSVFSGRFNVSFLEPNKMFTDKERIAILEQIKLLGGDIKFQYGTSIYSPEVDDMNTDLSTHAISKEEADDLPF